MPTVLTQTAAQQPPALIGITCDVENHLDHRGAVTERFFSPRAYSNAVLAAGACATLLPIAEKQHGAILINFLDGLVITGGAFDIAPSLYGEAPRPGLGAVREERSAWEFGLIENALQRRLPTLGICGGMQLINVVCGGTLFQDLSERPHSWQHEQPQPRNLPHHSVTLERGSLLQRCFATTELMVNSTHHQALRRLGPAVRAIAHAPDGLVEAITVENEDFCIGVQWHPEALDHQAGLPLYRALVEAALKYRAARAP